MTKAISLSSCKIGRTGTVAYLNTDDEAKMRKLMAMGVMPGIKVVLEQRFPSYIIQVGRSRTAIDSETAEAIYIIS